MSIDVVFYFAAGGALIQSLVLGLILLRPRRGQAGQETPSVSSRLLIAILAAASLNILHPLTIFPSAATGHRLLIEPLQFLLPPLFAAYVKALLDPSFKLRAFHLLHLAPTLPVIGVSAALAVARGVDESAVENMSIALWVALLVQALVYLRVAMRDIGRYRESLETEVSNLKGVDPLWLRWFSRVLHGIYFLYALVPFLLIHFAPSMQMIRNFISLVLSLSVSLLCYRQVLGKIPPPRPAPEPAPAAAEREPLDGRKGYAADLPAMLESVMERERLYLRSDLDLGALAKRLGWPRNEVSAAINGHFGLNFYEFVNGYRVREVKVLMDDPKYERLTLYAIALEAGFNSKPTFNAVFKKLAGCTPSEYYRRRKLV